LNLHATAVIAEIEGYFSVAPDILFGYCVGLCFDFDFVGMVVAPSGAVASTYRALAYVDVLGETRDSDCDGAAVAAGGDGSVCGCHLVSFCSVGVCLRVCDR
jgi:hypothetical protein